MMKLLAQLFKTLRRDVDKSPANMADSPAQMDHASQLISQGNRKEDEGDIEQARLLYERALQIKPGFAPAYVNLGNIFLIEGSTELAIGAYQRAISHQPHFPSAYFNLGNAYVDAGDSINAIRAYETALAQKSDFIDAHIALGNACAESHQYQRAIDCYLAALKLDPSYAEVYVNLAVAYKEAGELPLAVQCCKECIHLCPSYTQAHVSLADYLREMGDVDAAVEACQKAIDLHPTSAVVFSQWLFTLSHSAKMSAAQLAAAHAAFGDQFENPFRTSWPIHSNLRLPGRRLRVGFVSADLRAHAVAAFVATLFESLAKDPSIEVFVYYNYGSYDAVTSRLRKYVDHWLDVVTLNDEQLAVKIAIDGIDILIDLSGHTGGHRLTMFARKPAPIQVSWIGYAGSTGLLAMDYYLADPYLLPWNLLDSQFTEKIVRLPINAPFQPFSPSPEVGPLPALVEGIFTFGSFNRLDKIDRKVVALWAKVLSAVPQSRMLLGGLPAGHGEKKIVSWFAECGVPDSRLEVHTRATMQEYLSLHHRVDLCLDTFPYSGATTTLHACWMGVPTLTRPGEWAVGRSSVSILGHLGLLSEFSVDSDQAYVLRACYYAEHTAELSLIRRALRQRLLESAFLAPENVGKSFVYAVQEMWRRWCQGDKPASFEIKAAAGKDFCVMLLPERKTAE